jgi:hypothetical protein
MMDGKCTFTLFAQKPARRYEVEGVVNQICLNSPWARGSAIGRQVVMARLGWARVRDGFSGLKRGEMRPTNRRQKAQS